ncbi:hypothetical protein [uncultured Tenacibaculum sp.]|uniref:hypothetical protein n=1 Tax=uncultured Tenacibaculum sp. TaxID=174713 RepID=UPI00260DBF59|nr:hypothetical protein [uncultured Tenacibaculum sp.]
MNLYFRYKARRMKGKYIYLLFTLLFPICFLGAQTGPGGVGTVGGGTSLVLWLRPQSAGNTNSLWVDSSGRGFDFGDGNGAVLNTADINGYNSYSFNGSSNYFEKSFESVLNPNTFSVFSATNVTSSGGFKAVVSNRDDPSGAPTRGFILYSRPGTNRWDFWTGRDAGPWQTTGNSLSTSGSWAVQNLFYENTASNNKRLFINNTLNQTSSHSMTLNTIRPFRVGAGRNENLTPNYYFNGRIGEIIMFDVLLNDAERTIINNYLSAKYNFTLTSNDLYNEDTSTGDFDHKVAGIGQASDGSNHTDSQGTGIIRINTPSNLNNNEYLFWGEDQINSGYTFSTVAPANKRYRVNTKWRVSETGDVGTVTFSVNETDLDLTGVPTGVFKLLRSTLSDFSSIVEEYDLNLSGGVYSATVSFNDNDYFTLETVPTVDLKLTKTVNNAIPKVGNVVIFTLSVSNAGPQNATGVVIRDLLPSGFTYDSGSSSITTGTYDDATGDWDLSGVTINAGAPPITIQIGATITSAGILINTTEIISIDQEDIDSEPNSGN